MLESNVSALKDIEEVQESVVAEPKALVPGRLSPEWSDYVLSQFADDEVVIKREVRGGKDVVNRYPKVDGLRRLFQVYIGEIFETDIQCISAPRLMDNGGYDFCSYRFAVKYIRHDDNERNIRLASEVADVFYRDADFNNIDAPFNTFPSTIAATRAEARTYRKALGLKVCSYDELPKLVHEQVAKQETVKTVNPDEVTKKKVDPGQIHFLNTNCKRLDIDVWGLLNSKKTFKSIEEVSFDIAQDYCKLVGDMIRAQTNNKNVVADYVKTHNVKLDKYNKNWNKK